MTRMERRRCRNIDNDRSIVGFDEVQRRTMLKRLSRKGIWVVL